MTTLTTQFNLRTDNNGVPGTIINSPLNTGESFFLEVLMGDIRDNAVGITSSNLTFSFDANQVQNINSSFNITALSSPLLPSSFPFGRTGSLDNNNGTITNLGAGSIPSFGVGSPIGINQLDRFSLLHFQLIGSETSPLTLTIDLSQTSFTDGTFASDSSNQTQFIKNIEVTNNSQSVPESFPMSGILLISCFFLIKTIDSSIKTFLTD